MNFKSQIPNLITLGNLLCGVIGILVLCDITLLHSFKINANNFLLILFAAGLGFDFLDGAIARLLKVTSPLGKQLDSLSDLVTFGVFPALFFIMSNIKAGFLPIQDGHSILIYSPILIPLASAYRLAKFNVDERQGDHFYGLPTPANGFFFFSLAYLHPIWKNVPYLEYFYNPYVILGLVIGFSILMVSSVPLLSLKFKSFALGPNISRYLLLGISLILLIIWFIEAIPFIIGIYFLLSVIDLQLLNRNRT